MWSNKIVFRGKEYEERFAKGLENLPEARMIREEVFVKEQGFVNEFDDIDTDAWHCVIFSDGRPAATGRLYRDKEPFIGHIGRIAVMKEERGKGLGWLLMADLEQLARENDLDSIVVSAQCRVQGFYASLGYIAEGDVYPDEGCPHIMMRKIIDRQ
jgi:predicted GNAT family N-acyltransferase